MLPSEAWGTHVPASSQESMQNLGDTAPPRGGGGGGGNDLECPLECTPAPGSDRAPSLVLYDRDQD